MLLGLFYPSSTLAQSYTTVTATVTDSSAAATPYALGSYSVVLINNSGQQPLFGGNANFQQNFTGQQLSSTGVLSIVLPSVTVMTPGGMQWQFRICANPQQIAAVFPPVALPCFNYTSTGTLISGTSVDLSAQIKAVATTIPLPAGSGASSFPVITPVTVNSGGSISTTGTGTITATNGTGGTANPSGPIMALYFTNACPVANTGQCYFTAANTQSVNDCTWSSGAATVTCATSHFVAGDVGKRVAGYFKTDSFGSIFGCVAGRISFSTMTTGTLTISGFTSGTSITLSGNPSNTATGNNGCFIWGTPDDSNASTFETAYAAIAAFCPKVMLAAAGYWFSSPHFSSQPVGCAALPSLVGASTQFGNMVYTAGFELEGRGPGNTVIYLGPDFPNGDTCARTQGGIINACFLVPVEGKWTDLQITGGGQLTCQVPATKILIGVTVGTLNNIALTNFCQNSTGNQIGIKADLLSQLYQVNNSGFGAVCLQTVANEPYVQAFKLACENSPGLSAGTGATVDILADGGTTPTFTCIGCLLLGAISSTNMNVIAVATGANVRLSNGTLANCEAGASVCTTTATVLAQVKGTLYLTDETEIAQGGASLVAGLSCAASGGITYMERSNLINIGSVNYGDVAGCKLFDLGGNKNMTAPTILGAVFGSPSTNGPLAAANITPTSGFGTGCSTAGQCISAVSGTQQLGQFTVTYGTTPSSPQVITIAFPATFMGAPLCRLTDVGGTNAFPTSITTTTCTTSSASFTIVNTPVGGSTDIFQLSTGSPL